MSFAHIVRFVGDLKENFGRHQFSLQLYNRFLETKVETDADKKLQEDTFFKFISENEEAISNRDSTKFVNPNIIFKPKVEIKLGEIFKIADDDAQKVIWKHLLVIKTSYNPTETALEELKNDDLFNTATNEGKFLDKLFKTISGKCEGEVSQDPMSLITSLGQSDDVNSVISDMSKGFSDGSLDVGALLNSAFGMIGKLGGGQPGGADGMPDMSGMMGMISGMLGNLNADGGGTKQITPD
jgi:hypothetical protein